MYVHVFVMTISRVSETLDESVLIATVSNGSIQ